MHNETKNSGTPDLSRLLAAAPQLAKYLRATVPGLNVEAHPTSAPSDDRPLFSVITRTRGTRMPMLREVALCLAGQVCEDFEWLIVGHKCEAHAEAEILAMIEDYPPDFRQKARFVACVGEGRSAPLNTGVEESNGSYVVFLDDDDYVFSHWLSTFEDLAKQTSGELLRTNCAKRDYKSVPNAKGEIEPQLETWFELPWPASYDPLVHILENKTPFMSVAFPREVFSVLGLRFDADLTTLEDWQLTTRAAGLCGVRSSSELTAVYRWWTDGGSSSFEHSSDEWTANQKTITTQTNNAPVLLPAGTIAKLERDNRELTKLRRELAFSNRFGVAGPIVSRTEALAMKTGIKQRFRSALKALAPAAAAGARAIRGSKLERAGRTLLRKKRHQRELKLVEKSGFFDADWYRSQYPDVASLDDAQALRHFISDGQFENRDPGPNFSVHSYYENNPDVASGSSSALLHYIEHGRAENRYFTPVTDAELSE